MTLEALKEEVNLVISDDKIDGTSTNQLETIGGIPIQIRTNMHEKFNRPAGVTLFGTFFIFNDVSSKRNFHKALVLCTTFIAYTCFHMARRPLSVVKNVLNRNCSEVYGDTALSGLGDVPSKDPNWCDFAPFDDNATANQLLAILDFAFLFSYAFFMFFAGFLADRCNIRYFLSGATILSGYLLYAFGAAYYLDIHSMAYFVVVQILSGAVQSVGLPSTVSCMGHWFERSSRGSIFGLWYSNTSLGNILGATIAGYFVERGWGLSFIVPGFIMLAAGVMVFLFLVPKPEDVGLLSTSAIRNMDGNSNRRSATENETIAHLNSHVDGKKQILPDHEQSPLLSITSSIDSSDIHTPAHAVSFWTCLQIPGVVEYSLSLGFAKLVTSTFLYWLPRYITQSTLNSSEHSAYLSVPFDLGGMLGAILAGYLSDKYKKSALTCTVMLVLAIPSMMIYQQFAHLSNVYNICIQLLAGSLVNGPNALITTAVSADLGCRIKDGKAMATVAAIIDGTGSIGAAIGPLFAGYVSDSGWKSVFAMLMISDLLAAICLIRLTLKETGIR